MLLTGFGLALSIVFLPVGIAIGLLGLFVLVEGVFTPIERPLKLSNLLDTDTLNL